MGTADEPSMINIASWVAVALAPILIAIWRSNRLEDRNSGVNPYKWGFYVGYGFLISAGLGVWELMSLQTDVKDALWGNKWEAADIGFSTVIGLGLIFRLRIGWWLYFVSLLGLPLFLLGIYVLGDEGLVLPDNVDLRFLFVGPGIIFIIYILLNVFYARNRWHEFHPRRDEA